MNLMNEHGWQMSSYELRNRLGLKGGNHLPDEGMPRKDVDGVQVYILPKSDDPWHRKHRVMCLCPICDAHIPAGRLHQHQKIHKGE